MGPRLRDAETEQTCTPDGCRSLDVPRALEPPVAAPAQTFETITEAARRTGVHPRTLRRRIADGSLTGYRVGPRLIRLDPAEVNGLLRPIPAAGRR